MTKQVSIFWQCLATLLVPTGLLAFKRINKLRMGILLYLITYVLASIAFSLYGFVMYSPTDYINLADNLILLLALILLLSTFALPMWYIGKWSQAYNTQVTQSKTNIPEPS